MKIKFAKVRETGIIPTKEKENAGYDIYGDWSGLDPVGSIIHPLETKLIPTSIACALPEGYYFQVEERGSTGSKGIKKSAGVVDSGYRGEIFIAITNCNDRPVVFIDTPEDATEDNIYYPKSKAIAQLVLHKVPELEVEEISFEELQAIPSNRGAGALGSSGK